MRKDGRWYLSAFYSIAETMRHDAGDPDIPTAGVALNGGDSPEAAMDHMLDAVAGLDLDKVIGALNPDEFEALQRYAPLFTDDAQQALDDAGVSAEGHRHEVRRSPVPAPPATSASRASRSR